MLTLRPRDDDDDKRAFPLGSQLADTIESFFKNKIDVLSPSEIVFAYRMRGNLRRKSVVESSFRRRVGTRLKRAERPVVVSDRDDVLFGTSGNTSDGY